MLVSELVWADPEAEQNRFIATFRNPRLNIYGVVCETHLARISRIVETRVQNIRAASICMSDSFVSIFRSELEARHFRFGTFDYRH